MKRNIRPLILARSLAAATFTPGTKAARPLLLELVPTSDGEVFPKLTVQNASEAASGRRSASHSTPGGVRRGWEATARSPAARE